MRVSSIWRNRANDAWVVSIAFADDSRYHIEATEEVQRLIDEATKELREEKGRLETVVRAAELDNMILREENERLREENEIAREVIEDAHAAMTRGRDIVEGYWGRRS
jgi:hypothetical protein